MTTSSETLASRLGWAAMSGVLVTLQRFGNEYQKAGNLRWAFVAGHLSSMALLCYVSILLADQYDLNRAQTAVLTMVMCTLGVPNVEKLVRAAVFRWAGLAEPKSEPTTVFHSCDTSVSIPSASATATVQAVGADTPQRPSEVGLAEVKKLADGPLPPITGDMILKLGKLNRTERGE